jgi:hypothetical protein
MMKAAIASALLMVSAIAVAGDRPGSDMPGWMTGAWSRSDGENWADEYWTPPRAGIMIGAGRSGEGDKLQFWEHMRIVREESGLVFIAVAGDQKPVRFVEAKRLGREIIFENGAHDYPQRIRYWREGKQLKARISMIDGSRPVEFSFKLASGAK